MNAPLTNRARQRISIREIERADVDRVISMILRGFEVPFSRDFWTGVFDCLGTREVPDGYGRFGYLMEASGTIVGFLLHIYSTVWEDGHPRIRCNGSTLYVEPGFRLYTKMLTSIATRQEGVTVLNVSASTHTHEFMRTIGFKRYSNGIFACMPILALARQRKGVSILDGAVQPDVPCSEHEQRLVRDHLAYGCIAVWCATAMSATPIVFRIRRVAGRFPCAHIVYCRDLSDFTENARAIGRALAPKVLFVSVDAERAMPGLPGFFKAGRMVRHYHGDRPPRLGDLAYTEAAMFGI